MAKTAFSWAEKGKKTSKKKNVLGKTSFSSSNSLGLANFLIPRTVERAGRRGRDTHISILFTGSSSLVRSPDFPPWKVCFTCSAPKATWPLTAGHSPCHHHSGTSGLDGGCFGTPVPNPPEGQHRRMGSRPGACPDRGIHLLGNSKKTT